MVDLYLGKICIVILHQIHEKVYLIALTNIGGSIKPVHVYLLIT